MPLTRWSTHTLPTIRSRPDPKTSHISLTATNWTDETPEARSKHCPRRQQEVQWAVDRTAIGMDKARRRTGTAQTGRRPIVRLQAGIESAVGGTITALLAIAMGRHTAALTYLHLRQTAQGIPYRCRHTWLVTETLNVGKVVDGTTPAAGMAVGAITPASTPTYRATTKVPGELRQRMERATTDIATDHYETTAIKTTLLRGNSVATMTSMSCLVEATVIEATNVVSLAETMIAIPLREITGGQGAEARSVTEKGIGHEGRVMTVAMLTDVERTRSTSCIWQQSGIDDLTISSS